MKTRIAQPTAPLLCPATRITIEALVAIRTRQAGETEKDHHWKALECLLAGDLPQPTALHQCPDWAQRKLESEVSTAVNNLQGVAAELINTQERRGCKPRAARKASLEERHATLAAQKKQVKNK